MPKLFPMMIELEESAVGRVYNWLDAQPGVAKIRIGDKAVRGSSRSNGEDSEPHERAARGPYKKYNETGDEALIKAMYGKPPMTVSQMADVFEALGRSRVSVHSLVHKLKASGDLTLRDDGYVLSRKLKDRLRHQIAARKKRR